MQTKLELTLTEEPAEDKDCLCYWSLSSEYRHLKSIAYDSEEAAIDALRAGELSWELDGK